MTDGVEVNTELTCHLGDFTLVLGDEVCARWGYSGARDLAGESISDFTRASADELANMTFRSSDLPLRITHPCADSVVVDGLFAQLACSSTISTTNRTSGLTPFIHHFRRRIACG
ncbi:hypothetical protein [Mycobacteroides abscessus]|uniref:hypothetical protein n=1 Tax=Mycobacteroides abscessus TaxID=36809 RepID=UPI001F1D1625|nr:hypothetical protein [Mycobacteroides abscessus]